MKTICFDLRALQIGHQNRGIGMYIRSILEHIPDDGNKYLFYCFDINNPIKNLDIQTAVKYEIVQTKTVNTVLNSPRDLLAIYKLVHHDFAALKPYHPDRFVQFDFTLGVPPWKGTQTIVIGYDLIPLIMKNEYMPSVRYAWGHAARKFRGVLRALYYRYKYNLHYTSYKQADRVVCISKDSASSFRNLLDIPEEKIVTIPLAPVLAAMAPDIGLAKSIGNPYVFYIGGTDSRKHVQDIVRAYNISRGRGADLALVLAGHEFSSLNKMTDILAKQAIMNSPYRDDIKLIGFVSDAEKHGLYKSAHAFVFTSSYEGFGLPVVEAMAAGCPVIAYNNSSIPEAAGDAGLLIPTGDYVAVAQQIIALQDDKLREKTIRAGLKQAATFSWARYMEDFTAIL